MSQHDASYRLLFSHPELVADLLRGFLPGEWVGALDLASLEPLSASYVSDRLERREGDRIWRIRWGPNWLYVLILLEFQSSNDPHMAVRIGAYGNLLYQELLRSRIIPADARLPALLPIVVYNGLRPWTGATDLSALIETPPAGLEAYQLNARYLLIDENRISDATLDGLERNLAAALFQLERSPSIEALTALLQALNVWLRAPNQTSLRRALAVWVRRVLLPLRLPNVEIPEVAELEELETMLAERVVEWTEQWKREGLKQGLEQGRQEERQLLLRQTDVRFGADYAASLEPLINEVTDGAVLTRIGEIVVQATSGEQLLAGVKALLA